VDVGISEHTAKVCDASRTDCSARVTFGQLEAYMVKGLGTVIYRVTDLDRAKAWYSKAFQQTPYFDQPFYVGFSIGGYELGLDPDPSGGKAGPGGSVAYWRVPDIEDAVRHFVSSGAAVVAPAQGVGEGIKVATVSDPFANLIGLIENPHFELPKG
jgi:predicted enzyme related to lactoylglutathione lyase